MRGRGTWPALLLALLLVIGATTALAQSPLGGGSGRALTGPAITAPAQPTSVMGKFWVEVREIQQNLHRQLAGAVRRIKTEGFTAGWFLAGLAFVYGVVHAAGPGHGKAVISSYLIAEERTVRRGVLLSFLAAAAQAVSAVALVGILALALGAAGMQIKSASDWMERASYGLVALVGLWMTYAQIRALLASRRVVQHAHAHHAHDHAHAHHGHAHHDHGPGEACHHAHMPDPADLKGDMSLRKMAAVVLAVGVRPCTGAIVVLVFALANGLFLAGVGATFAMALGTAVTVSALAALAVGSKQLAVKLASGNEVWGDRVYRGAALLGSVLLLFMGATLFIASLGPTRPF